MAAAEDGGITGVLVPTYSVSRITNRNLNPTQQESMKEPLIPPAPCNTIGNTSTVATPTRVQLDSTVRHIRKRRKYPVYGRRWWVLFVFSGLSCLRSVLCYSYAPVNTRIEQYYNVSEVQLALFETVYFISFVLITMPTSMLIDRKGLRIAVVCAAWSQAFGAVMRFYGSWLWPELAPEHQYKLALGGQFIASLGQAVFANATPLVAAIWFSKTERAMATTIGVSASFFGVAVAYIISPILVHPAKESVDSVRRMLEWYALCCIIFAFLATVYFPERPPCPPSYTAELKLREWVRFETMRIKKKFDHAMLQLGYVKTAFRPSFVGSQVPNQAVDSPPVPQDLLDWPVLKISQRTKDRLRMLLPFSTKSNQERMMDGEDSLFSMLWSELKILWSFHKDKGFVHTVLAFALAELLCNIYSVAMNGLLIPLGLSLRFVSMMGIAYILSLVVGSIIIGVLMERTGVKYLKATMVMSCVLLGAAQTWFTLLSTEETGDPYKVAAAICLAGFFTGPLQPLALEIAAECTYPSSETAFTSLMQIIANITSAVLVPFMFFLRDISIHKQRLTGGNILQVALIVALGLVFLTFGGEMRRAKQDGCGDHNASLVEAQSINQADPNNNSSHNTPRIRGLASASSGILRLPSQSHLQRDKTFTWHPRFGYRSSADSDDDEEDEVLYQAVDGLSPHRRPLDFEETRDFTFIQPKSTLNPGEDSGVLTQNNLDKLIHGKAPFPIGDVYENKNSSNNNNSNVVSMIANSSDNSQNTEKSEKSSISSSQYSWTDAIPIERQGLPALTIREPSFNAVAVRQVSQDMHEPSYPQQQVLHE